MILRNFKENDLYDFYEYAKVPGVGELAGWKHHKTIEETKKVLDLFILDKLTFAIELDNKVIGSICFHNSWANEKFPELNIKELGYVLNKDYWGKGIMLNAVDKMLCYGFNELGLVAVTVCHFNTNNQSKRVIEKAGFTFAQEDTYGDDKILESQYILFKDEYKKRNT